MRVGIAIEETWDFLHEIAADLQDHHDVSLFERRAWQLPFFRTRVNNKLFIHDLRKFMARNDVVFFEWASHLLEAATHLPKECGIVTRLHRYEMYQFVERINWDAVDKIILVSQAKKQEFLEQVPDQASKIVVINEAVDPEKFCFTPKPFNGDIGTLCHLTPRKRVYELILTFSELCKKRDDLHLHIAGGAHVAHQDYYFSLHELVHKLDLQRKVTFYGNVKEPWDWYRNVDIFISNSYSEGLQVAPMEAMASGCYVLSHFWGGADELLPEKYLYYSDQELQDLILHFCELSETERQAQKQLMRQIVCTKFDVHKSKVQVRQIIESAAQG